MDLESFRPREPLGDSSGTTIYHSFNVGTDGVDRITQDGFAVLVTFKDGRQFLVTGAGLGKVKRSAGGEEKRK